MSGADGMTMKELLAAKPAFARAVMQFTTLRDAASILDEAKPPYGNTAAEYLRAVADNMMRNTGVGDEFVQAMIAAMPKVPHI